MHLDLDTLLAADSFVIGIAGIIMLWPTPGLVDTYLS